MPSRVIRDGLLTSKSLRAVPVEVELTFVHLLLVVDDFGRFDADPDVLASALYPTRRAITPETVIAHVETLAAQHDPALVLYVADGKRFLQLTGWERHRAGTKRAARSKYPEPPRIPERSMGIHGDPWGSADPQPGEGEGEGVGSGRGSAEGERPSAVPSPAAPAPQQPVGSVEQTAEATASEPAPKRRRKPSKPRELTSAPDSLSPEQFDSLRSWLTRRGYGWFESALTRAVDRCLAYHRGKGSQHANWVSTCQTWIIGDIDRLLTPRCDPERERITERTAKDRAFRERFGHETAAPAVRSPPAPDEPVPVVEIPFPFTIRSVGGTAQ